MSTPTTSPAPVSPEASDNPWAGTGGIRRWWRYTNDWLRALSPAGATVYDTGFIELPIQMQGMNGNVWYARSGKWVTIQIDLQGGLASGGTIPVLAQLPAGLGPSKGRAAGAIYLDGGYPGVARVTAGGFISIAQQTGATRNNPVGTVVYKLA